MKHSLKNYLHTYLGDHPGWHKKVELYIIGDDYGCSPESTGRKLRELEQEGQIQLTYYNGKYSRNLVKYASLSVKKPTKPKVILKEVNGVMVAVME